MRISLGTFACTGITTQMGVDLPTGVRAALLHYAGKLRSGRKPVGIPAFFRDPAPRESGVAVVDLTVDAQTQALLEQEAVRQGASMNQLVAHSVFIYLAELDFLGAPPALGGGGSTAKA
jgi:hypothetical protein